jgi:hypothetical protein
MPTVSQEIQDAVRRADRQLSIIWEPRCERFLLVKETPQGYHEVHRFEDALGGFAHPRLDTLMQQLQSSDIAKCPGLTFTDKARVFMQRMNRHNEALKEKERQRIWQDNKDLAQDYRKAAQKFDGDAAQVSKHMRSRSEVRKLQKEAAQ